MKIPKDLPQFDGQQVVFVVTGKQVAVFYAAHDGNLEEYATVTIEKPQRKETYLEVHGGRVFRSGAASERMVEKMKKEFIVVLHQKLAAVRTELKPTRVYLFAPAYMVQIVEQAFPVQTRKKILTVYEGNYTRFHPKQLLEKIEKDIEETRERMSFSHSSTESRKILRKTRRTGTYGKG